ncbi:MAG: hypothetical protein HOW73_09875 [Polyangiaceae bacterium]|nr:hypothetical protein [Polyangiaceae bacterium]
MRFLPTAFAITATAGLLFGACRNIVVGDPVDAGSELCALLQDCYPNEHYCESLEGSDAEWSTFLQGFDSASCLSSCAEARACADARPFCGEAACDTLQDCCGWSQGLSTCATFETDEGTSSVCCRPNGVECSSNEQCCEGFCSDGFCGGYECRLVGEACGDDIECCTFLCIEGACSEKNCSDPGEPCMVDDDCCQLDDVVGEGDVSASAKLLCREGLCSFGDEPVCAGPGSLCDEQIPCCEGECVPSPSGQGLCGEEGCIGLQEPCDPFGTSTCCEPGFCNPNLSQCTPAIDCVGEGSPCQDVPCCDGLACTNEGCAYNECKPIDCHDVCEVGAPLDIECAADPVTQQCIANVLSMAPGCGCFGWDEFCVVQAAQACQECLSVDPGN